MAEQFRTVPPPSVQLTPTLSPVESDYYDHLYSLLNPQGVPRVKGRKLAELFKKSGLSRETLKKIYEQAVTSYDRTLDKREFLIFTKLVSLAQSDIPPLLENLGQASSLPCLEGIKLPELYTLTQEHILYYSNYFTRVCGGAELIDGSKLKELFGQSEISPIALKKCWNLVDIAHKGSMTKGEFIVFMLLVSAAGIVQPPLKLPDYLAQFIHCFDEGGQRVSICDTSLESSRVIEENKQSQPNMKLSWKDLVKEDRSELAQIQGLASHACLILQNLELAKTKAQKFLTTMKTQMSQLKSHYVHLVRERDTVKETNEQTEIQQLLAEVKESNSQANLMEQAIIELGNDYEARKERTAKKLGELLTLRKASQQKEGKVNVLKEEYEKLTGHSYLSGSPTHRKRKSAYRAIDEGIRFHFKDEDDLYGGDSDLISFSEFV